MNRLKTKLFTTVAAGIMLSVTAAKADFVINDDLIVDGSACIGFDCANGESFGSDTLILKENNLRILFQDTSTTASFPSTDWRLIANDSTNGGSNSFSIENASLSRIMFSVQADAQANALVLRGNRAGFGTSNPVTEIHTADGDTPTVRLEQDGSSGWTPQTWDVAGNETNFFVRDVTNGSALPFKILPGAPSDSFVVATGGDVGVGTRSPDARLQVTGGDGVLMLSDTDSTNSDKRGYLTTPSFTNRTVSAMTLTTRDDKNVLSFGGGNAAFDAPSSISFVTGVFPGTGNGADRMRISEDGKISMAGAVTAAGNILQVGTDATNGAGASLTTAGVWTNASTRANKIKIKELGTTEAIDAVNNLTTVTYYGKNHTTEKYVGFIAEDVPDLVATENRKGIAAIEISALLAKVVKEQHKTVTSQQNEIAAQKTLIEKLASRLDALEASIRRRTQ